MLALFERSNNIALSGSVVVVVVIGPSGLVWFCWERERFRDLLEGNCNSFWLFDNTYSTSR